MLASINHADVATAVYGAQHSFRKAKADVPTTISVHEIFSQSTPSVSEKQSLEGATKDSVGLLNAPRRVRDS